MILLFIIGTPFVAFLGSLLVKKNSRILNWITLCATTLEIIFITTIILSVIKNGPYNFSNYFSVDALGAIVIGLVSIVSFISSWHSISYLKIEMSKNIIGFRRKRQYFVLLHLFILAMFFAITTTSPIFMWISIEATTLSTVFLISFYNKPSATEAAWKYLIINSTGLLLGFFGTLLFLYTSTHTSSNWFISWQTILNNIDSFDPFITKIAFVFLLIGFGTKVGLVPMHTWRPDAYSKAPAPIVALLSDALLNVAFLAILRFKMITDLSIGKEFSSNLLITLGILSIIVATFSIFNQKNYKRLLSYSSIEHAGIMAIGFGFGGIGMFAALLHMIYHSLAKSIMFLSSGNILLKYSSTKIKNVRNMLTTLPITSILFIIGFLAVTGTPPFGIFTTEILILSVGIQSHPIIVMIMLFSLALIFIGFLRHISAMIFSKDKIEDENNEIEITNGENGVWTIIPIVILTILFIFLSFYIPIGIQSLLYTATI